MKRIVAYLGLALSALATGALAADNAVVVTVGVGTTMRSKDIGAGVQSMVQILGDTAGTPMSFTGFNQTSPGNGIQVGGVVGTATIVSGNSSPFYIDTSGNLKTTLGTSTVIISNLAGSLIWPPGTHPVTGIGTFTTSGITGSNFVAPVQIGGSITLTTSATAGSNTVSLNSITVTAPVSPAAGTLTWPPGTVTAITSNSSAALVTAVNCINGCAASNISGTYNQNPATIPSGGTSGLQMDQNGALKVNITSALTATLAVSPSVSSLPQTGNMGDTVCATDTGTCTLISLTKRINQNLSGAIPAGTNTIGNVGLAAGTTGGCTSVYITASTASVLTQVKGSAGTLCWMRIINTSAVTALVKIYDSAGLGQDNLVCGNKSTLPVSYDVAQPNTVSPGLVANLGSYGAAFVNGIDVCLSGFAGTWLISDITSLTTNAIMVNVGYK